MRAYTVRDLDTVTDILAEAVKSGGGLSNILRAAGGGGVDSGGASEDERGLGIASYVVSNLLTAPVRRKTLAWFASLVGVELDNYMNRPPITVLDTVKEIVNNPESKGFFLQASALFKEIAASGTPTASA